MSYPLPRLIRQRIQIIERYFTVVKISPRGKLMNFLHFPPPQVNVQEASIPDFCYPDKNLWLPVVHYDRSVHRFQGFKLFNTKTVIPNGTHRRATNEGVGRREGNGNSVWSTHKLFPFIISENNSSHVVLKS